MVPRMNEIDLKFPRERKTNFPIYNGNYQLKALDLTTARNTRLLSYHKFTLITIFT